MNQQTDETLSTGTESDTASTLHSDSVITEHGVVLSDEKLERLVKVFENMYKDSFLRLSRDTRDQKRRLELIVYPSLLAFFVVFFVVAAYGFYLIYNVTHDIGIIARSIDHNMGENMGSISGYIGDMSQNILRLADSNDRSRDDLRKVTGHTGNISRRLDQMEPNISAISVELNQMQSTITELVKTNKLPPAQPHPQQPYTRYP
jgi:hypothetical protein